MPRRSIPRCRRRRSVAEPFGRALDRTAGVAVLHRLSDHRMRPPSALWPTQLLVLARPDGPARVGDRRTRQTPSHHRMASWPQESAWTVAALSRPLRPRTSCSDCGRTGRPSTAVAGSEQNAPTNRTREKNPPKQRNSAGQRRRLNVGAIIRHRPGHQNGERGDPCTTKKDKPGHPTAIELAG